jgi:hypothetical protein
MQQALTLTSHHDALQIDDVEDNYTSQQQQQRAGEQF